MLHCAVNIKIIEKKVIELCSTEQLTLMKYMYVLTFIVQSKSKFGRGSGLVVERRTPERGRGSTLTQVAVLYP